MCRDGVVCVIAVQGEEEKIGSTVRVTMDDDDVVYPITINKGLIVAGLTPDVIDDICDATATLFGSNVALINLEALMASHVMALMTMNHSRKVALVSVPDLLSRMASLKCSKLRMGKLFMLLKFTNYVSLSCLSILILALDICLGIKNRVRSLITLLWCIIGLL